MHKKISNSLSCLNRDDSLLKIIPWTKFPGSLPLGILWCLHSTSLLTAVNALLFSTQTFTFISPVGTYSLWGRYFSLRYDWCWKWVQKFVGRETHTLWECDHTASFPQGVKMKRANPWEGRHLQPDWDATPSGYVPEEGADAPPGEPTI